MDPKRECLYDVQWQLLRVGLLNNWHKDPEANVRYLLRYLSRADGEYERFLRTWRCLNLLNAVPLGEDKQVRKVISRSRRAFKIRFDKFNGFLKFRPWNWTATRAELEWLYTNEPDSFARLKANLERRIAKVGQSSSVGYMQQKPEAAKFIRLMRDVEFDAKHR